MQLGDYAQRLFLSAKKTIHIAKLNTNIKNIWMLFQWNYETPYVTPFVIFTTRSYLNAEMSCGSIGRGACSRRTRLCALNSLVSIQSWSTKQAWSGNSGRWPASQDKVRHTQKHVDIACVYFVSSIQIIPTLCVCVCINDNPPALLPHCLFTPPQLAPVSAAWGASCLPYSPL